MLASINKNFQKQELQGYGFSIYAWFKSFACSQSRENRKIWFSPAKCLGNAAGFCCFWSSFICQIGAHLPAENAKSWSNQQKSIWMISKWLPWSHVESTILRRTFYRSNNWAGNIYNVKHATNLRLTWVSLQCEF